LLQGLALQLLTKNFQLEFSVSPEHFQCEWNLLHVNGKLGKLFFPVKEWKFQKKS
jgi:hypothetical protein